MTKPGAVNLNRLHVFVAVVDAGSLTAAARRLGIAKTMVSTHMQRLEAELGVSLLVRTTRRVGITEAGKAFYEASRQIVQAADAAIDAVTGKDQADDRLQGVLRVAAPIDYGALVVAPALVALQQRHPSLRVELMSDDRVIDLIADGIDVAIRLGQLPDSTLRARRIGGFSKWLVASPAFLARHGVPETPEALSVLPYIAMSSLPHPLTITIDGPRGAQRIVRFDNTFQTNTANGCRAAALAGGGVALLTDFSIGDDVSAGRLTRLWPLWASPPAGIHAVYPAARHLPAKVRVLIDALKDGGAASY